MQERRGRTMKEARLSNKDCLAHQSNQSSLKHISAPNLDLPSLKAKGRQLSAFQTTCRGFPGTRTSMRAAACLSSQMTAPPNQVPSSWRKPRRLDKRKNFISRLETLNWSLNTPRSAKRRTKKIRKTFWEKIKASWARYRGCRLKMRSKRGSFRACRVQVNFYVTAWIKASQSKTSTRRSSLRCHRTRK